MATPIVQRSFRIQYETWLQMEELKDKLNIPMNQLANMLLSYALREDLTGKTDTPYEEKTEQPKVWKHEGEPPKATFEKTTGDPPDNIDNTTTGDPAPFNHRAALDSLNEEGPA